jgi:hypothetical protein
VAEAKHKPGTLCFCKLCVATCPRCGVLRVLTPGVIGLPWFSCCGETFVRRSASSIERFGPDRSLADDLATAAARKGKA